MIIVELLSKPVHNNKTLRSIFEAVAFRFHHEPIIIIIWSPQSERDNSCESVDVCMIIKSAKGHTYRLTFSACPFAIINIEVNWIEYNLSHTCVCVSPIVSLRCSSPVMNTLTLSLSLPSGKSWLVLTIAFTYPVPCDWLDDKSDRRRRRCVPPPCPHHSPPPCKWFCRAILASILSSCCNRASPQFNKHIEHTHLCLITFDYIADFFHYYYYYYCFS